MRFISYRGNLNGYRHYGIYENTAAAIFKAALKGFDVYVDAWISDGRLHTGSSRPVSPLDSTFIESDVLWVRARSMDALGYICKETSLKCTYHELSDSIALFNNNTILVRNIDDLMYPEISILFLEEYDANIKLPENLFAICSEYIDDWRVSIVGEDESLDELTITDPNDFIPESFFNNL